MGTSALFPTISRSLRRFKEITRDQKFFVQTVKVNFTPSGVFLNTTYGFSLGISKACRPDAIIFLLKPATKIGARQPYLGKGNAFLSAISSWILNRYVKSPQPQPSRIASLIP